jgi:hypothetical protein
VLDVKIKSDCVIYQICQSTSIFYSNQCVVSYNMLLTKGSLSNKAYIFKICMLYIVL